MGRQLQPARVYQTAKTALGAKTRSSAPVWFKALESIPPSEILTRPVPVQHHAPDPRIKKPKRLFKPQQIIYEEDQLRKDFYKDHPWELARPRIIMETDGMDSRRIDWSRGLRQTSVALTGESVVQRQLWLMHNVPGISKEQAYDTVRREFYALRQEEEIERRVTQEEARMVGAYFGKSKLQTGLEQEDMQYEKWRSWAAKELERVEAARSSMISSFGDESPPEEILDGEADK